MQKSASSLINAVSGKQADLWADSLYSVECILPAQFHERRTARSGEERLLHAVLKDAIAAYLGEEKEEVLEAARWLKDTTCKHPFSFENICDVFGIDSGWLRQRLMRQRAILADSRAAAAADQERLGRAA
jgi:hypothetical protein